MSEHHHHHDHGHSELSDVELRVRALESLLVEKGYVDPAALDELVQTYETKAIGITAADGKWETITVKRNVVGDDDIEFDIKYCGVCHSDVHIARDELQPFRKTNYPCVPGHELAGIATKV